MNVSIWAEMPKKSSNFIHFPCIHGIKWPGYKQVEYCRKIFISFIIIITMTSCIQLNTGRNYPEQQSDGTWVISVGSTQMKINPDHGARIISYTHDGKEILHMEPTPGLEDMVGSTCWISPQALWGWPPPYDADQGKYETQLEGDKLILTGPVDTTRGNDPFPFQIVKTFQACPEDFSITIHYQIFNRDTMVRSFAAWEVMRVPPSGLTFFPTDGPVFGNMAPAFELIDGIAWWDFDNNRDHVKKAYADGKDGWMAYVTKDRILHVKQFEDTPSYFPLDENGIPLQMEMEFWANEERRYLELEKQGEYKEILPGEYAELTMKCIALELPDSIKPKSGNDNMTNFVKRIFK
jgi:hypothetical protein